jgi:hypothetical protein
MKYSRIASLSLIGASSFILTTNAFAVGKDEEVKR